MPVSTCAGEEVGAREELAVAEVGIECALGGNGDAGGEKQRRRRLTTTAAAGQGTRTGCLGAAWRGRESASQRASGR